MVICLLNLHLEMYRLYRKMTINSHFSIYPIIFFCHYFVYNLLFFVWIPYFWGPPLNHLISKTTLKMNEYTEVPVYVLKTKLIIFIYPKVFQGIWKQIWMFFGRQQQEWQEALWYSRRCVNPWKRAVPHPLHHPLRLSLSTNPVLTWRMQ